MKTFFVIFLERGAVLGKVQIAARDMQHAYFLVAYLWPEHNHYIEGDENAV